MTWVDYGGDDFAYGKDHSSLVYMHFMGQNWWIISQMQTAAIKDFYWEADYTAARIKNTKSAKVAMMKVDMSNSTAFSTIIKKKYLTFLKPQQASDALWVEVDDAVKDVMNQPI